MSSSGVGVVFVKVDNPKDADISAGETTHTAKNKKKTVLNQAPPHRTVSSFPERKNGKDWGQNQTELKKINAIKN